MFIEYQGRVLSCMSTFKEDLFVKPGKYFFEIYFSHLSILLGSEIFALLDCKFDEH